MNSVTPRACRTTSWIDLCLYNSLDRVVQLLGLICVCTTPWIVSYNSLDCASYNSLDRVVQRRGLCRTTPWTVSYNSLGCIVKLLGLCLLRLCQTPPSIDLIGRYTTSERNLTPSYYEPGSPLPSACKMLILSILTAYLFGQFFSLFSSQKKSDNLRANVRFEF